MDFDTKRVGHLLSSFDFPKLFVEELGWDRHNATLSVSASGETFSLKAVAEKRGAVAWVCEPNSEGAIPQKAVRLLIDREVSKSAFEHIVVFVNAAKDAQVWVWPRRVPGRPIALVDHPWRAGGQNTNLIQRLRGLVFTLDEENDLQLPEVTTRLEASLNADRVTRRFYEQFAQEHKAFLSFIDGIEGVADREWYASLMLNRLMFVYFMQRKGFLDGNIHYLREKLASCQKDKGQDKFYSFYRYFLLALFHKGLGSRERDKELEKLLGRIPYLNGGLFEKHVIEQRSPDIQIPDDAFERIFAYFDRYQWHLDERPLRAENEINPDVLGYIFEKYINQKQMGAYYTKEDITGYITKNTVIPYLLDAAKTECRLAFENPGGPTVWDHLRDEPGRYIYEAVKKGVAEPLPDNVAAGIADVSKRTQWNAAAPESHALPTEVWREVVARRDRYEGLRQKLTNGDVRELSDLITLNLDIAQFAQDLVDRAEGPDLLRAMWKAVERVTVLDPTCGSGAFLFAALNVLEPLYDACLNRMETFVSDADRADGAGLRRFDDFRMILEKVATHPNRRYFILKSIILNNLFGVDIMEEAVEICKLRLFLKLAAQVEPDSSHPNLGIEPLPDIDFNMRAGNTLVGYATYADARSALSSRFDFESALDSIADRAAAIQATYRAFREQQIEDRGASPTANKEAIRSGLAELGNELNAYLAADQGVDARDSSALDSWNERNSPFHWFIEFFEIMERGGFDVIIGNPPYVTYPSKNVRYALDRYGYRTLSTKNLYAFVFERCLRLARQRSPVGLIVQLTAISSQRLPPLQQLLLERGHLFTVPFPRRPQPVFDGVEMPVVILLSHADAKRSLNTTDIVRFYADERPQVIQTLSFCQHSVVLHQHRIAKFGEEQEPHIYGLVAKNGGLLAGLTARSTKNVVYYQEACRYWLKASDRAPRFIRNGVAMEQPHGRKIGFESENAAAFAACLLNSSLFYWWYSAFSDCEHVNDALVRGFPVPSTWHSVNWTVLSGELRKSLSANAVPKTIRTGQGHTVEYDEISAAHSKPLIDRIDHQLAAIYGFSDHELDLIQNYDIKYRLAGTDESYDDAEATE